MERIFGEISGIVDGQEFGDRAALAAVGVHKPVRAGISYSEKNGADSIVLSGGYADDEDFGDLIVYTGMGGRDEETGKQIADQMFNRGNKGLAVSMREGLAVRVIRGSTHISPQSPAAGYRYAGLYRVEDYWHETGKHGYLVWRYRLVKRDSAISPIDAIPSQSRKPSGPVDRKTISVQRIVRDTQIAKGVKAKHSCQCQVCGTAIVTPSGLYAEAAHIQPLGRPHNGPDIEANILCLCPNHHVMFDNGMFSIADDFSLIGLPGNLRRVAQHTIDPTFLKYHREHYGVSK